MTEPPASRARPLTPEAIAKLRSFEEMLRARGAKLGLVAEGDLSRLWERHVLDSLRATRGVLESDRDAYDLGSGGGLPGIVVAVAIPSLRVQLVESRRRRLAWLELVVAELGLPNAEVRGGRVEDLTDPVDVCFARAFAPADRAWSMASPLLRRGGRLVYFAGRAASRSALGRIAENVRLVEAHPLESSGPIAIIANQ